ncbi:MAG: diacylglycerol kinase family lipid kinase [Kiritimatiellae bacterium]|nr:diacylglycerol kinase family lipid kinase [Kiritimatiellia bacterium]
MRKLLLIANPASGTRQARRLLPDFLGIFNEAGFLPSVFLTRRRGDAEAVARDLGGEADIVAACGGDGTLNEVISGLLAGGHATPVGYIPAGSTNDFAAGFGLSTDMLQACRDVASGSPRDLDVGLFSPDRCFTYTASFGLFAAVSHSTPQTAKNILGHAAYVLEGIRSLADVRPLHVKVTANGRTWEDDYLFGTVCNSTILGGGVLKLDDDQVHASDGLFESILIPFPPGPGALARLLADVRARKYEDSPFVTFVRASRFVFESDPAIPWTLDGEKAPVSPVQEIANLPRAVRVICPRGR